MGKDRSQGIGSRPVRFKPVTFMHVTTMFMTVSASMMLQAALAKFP